ncbi:T9SS type A sorting domain-containing protein [Reichenbachiella ulvae]|uniref:T9SS type A sorting domain-containing protein n=1 Tax=Reichenbachiella ulvae TaxID=2980104 RepID=A0ABT3CR45_9BACT|nr:T9SS type A sorting domain-containing protein [Reichenbachiella ulvae]MCV9385999.1 T9SS type A sorting domain-containing protein [Reichenbachiella ulvae]
MKIIPIYLLLLLIVGQALAQNGTVSKVAIKTQNNKASFLNPRGFVIYLPENFDDSGETKYPVIFWLHGLGKDGDGSLNNLNKIYNDQICEWLKTHDIPFIVFAPQDHNGYFGGAYPSRLTRFVQWATEEYVDNIDFYQLHLAGLSAGGYGIREFIVENDDLYKMFATLTPMSTNLNNANNYAQRIINNDQYVWIHHGTNDSSPNAIGAVENFHNAVQSLDPKRSRLTAYKGMGHSAWEEVYDNTGQGKEQLEGTISGTEYYNWTAEDDTWYEWLTLHTKTHAPSRLKISNTELEDEEAAGTIVGQLSGNGSYPRKYLLVSGEGDADNDKFSINSSNELVIEEATRFIDQSSYQVRVGLSNSEGSYEVPLVISVDGILSADANDYPGGISLYPNPVKVGTHSLILDLDNAYKGQLDYQIVNLSGALVTEGSWIKNSKVFSQPVNIESIERGIFILKLKGNDFQDSIQFIKM